MNQDFTTSEYALASLKERLLKRVALAQTEQAEYYANHKYSSDKIQERINTLNGIIYDIMVVECSLVLEDEPEFVPEEVYQ